MKTDSLLVFCTHGTYGRDDDLYGALLASNAALAKGLKVTLVLVEDGVFTGKKNQNTSKIGLPNSLEEIQDFIDLGGRLIVDATSLEERGISKDEIIEKAEIIPFKSITTLVEEHSISLTF